jgi:biopolymer transport protein ExbB
MKTSGLWKTAPGWLLAATAARAGTDAAGPAAEMLTTAEILRMGGWLMYALAALSVLGLALIVYYAMVLRARNVAPAAQALRLRELLKEKRGRDARELCAQQPTALAAVAAAGLDFLRENPSAKPGILKEVMESEGSRQAGRMQNMIHYLLDLSAVAPMVGLLGTVIGMLKAFNSVAFDLAKARPMELAAGVGQALITTIAGLFIAIPAMIAYAWFRGRVIKLIGQMEGSATDLLAIMENRGE